jgi:hypothetical protein
MDLFGEQEYRSAMAQPGNRKIKRKSGKEKNATMIRTDVRWYKNSGV